MISFWPIYIFRALDQNPDLELQATELRKDYYYLVYYTGLGRLFFLGIIPLILLAYFNYMIYKGMQLPSFLSEQENMVERRRMQESELAIVLIGIVVIFVLTHVLRIFLNIYHMIKVLVETEPCYPAWTELASYFNSLLLLLNSSANMIIYCCLNSTFRKYLKQYFQKILSKCTCSETTPTYQESW